MKYKASRFNIYLKNGENYIVTNTLSSSVMSLEREEFMNIKNNIFDDFSNDEIQQLNRQGLIIDADIDEISLLRNTYFSSKLDNREGHLTICPTLECNFACPYCYETRTKGKMSLEIQNDLISFIEVLIKTGIKKLYITWYGGEPLLYPSIIKRLSSRIKSLCNQYDVDLIISMISNGFLINKNLTLLREMSLSSIQITLDGAKDTHNKRRFLKSGADTFDVIVANIIEASKFTKINVRVNIDKGNISAFNDVKSIFKNYDNIECYCAPVTIERNQPESIKKNCFTPKEYYEFYERVDTNLFGDYNSGIKCCSAEMKNTYVIDPLGNMFKCLNDLGDHKWRISTLKSFDSGYNPAVVAKYLGRDPFSEEECKNCCFLPQCYGGCVWNYKNAGIHSCKSVKYLLAKQIVEKSF